MIFVLREIYISSKCKINWFGSIFSTITHKNIKVDQKQVCWVYLYILFINMTLRHGPESLWSVVDHRGAETEGLRFDFSRILITFSLSNARDETKIRLILCHYEKAIRYQSNYQWNVVRRPIETRVGQLPCLTSRYRFYFLNLLNYHQHGCCLESFDTLEKNLTKSPKPTHGQICILASSFGNDVISGFPVVIEFFDIILVLREIHI